MIVGKATHQTLAGEIHRLIRQEQYAAAQELIPSFAQAVIDTCNESGQQQDFLQAKQFLQSAVLAVKTRQAHYMTELSGLRHEQAYAGIREQRTSLDCTG